MELKVGNINVSLTSTKFSLMDTPSSTAADLIKKDVPVCAADMGVGAFGFSPSEKERFDHHWSKTCLDMAKEVIIDVENKAVYIGDNGNWLVEYQVDQSSIYSEHFFKRWLEIGVIFFEFTMQDIKGRPLFCIKGLWHNNRWSHIDVFYSSTCSIVAL